MPCKILGFCSEVAEVCVLLGNDVASLCNWFSIFLDHYVVSKCQEPQLPSDMTSYPRRTKPSAASPINILFKPSKGGREFICADVIKRHTLQAKLNYVSEKIIFFGYITKY
jgi:hypothetical protein